MMETRISIPRFSHSLPYHKVRPWAGENSKGKSSSTRTSRKRRPWRFV